MTTQLHRAVCCHVSEQIPYRRDFETNVSGLAKESYLFIYLFTNIIGETNVSTQVNFTGICFQNTEFRKLCNFVQY